MATSRLPEAQEHCLFVKYCTGDFPRRQWKTIAALLNRGYLAEVGKNLAVTPKGKAYCDLHHASIRL